MKMLKKCRERYSTIGVVAVSFNCTSVTMGRGEEVEIDEA